MFTGDRFWTAEEILPSKSTLYSRTVPSVGLPFPAVPDEHGVWVMDPTPLLAALGSLAGDGAHAGLLAAAFHASVARSAIVLAERACDANGLRTVVLGGGVFQNAILLTMVREALRRDGYRVLVPELLGPNDGAIS